MTKTVFASDLERAEAFWADYRQLESYRAVAAKHGVSYETVRLVLKEHGYLAEFERIQRERREARERMKDTNRRARTMRQIYSGASYDWSADSPGVHADRWPSAVLLDSVYQFLNDPASEGIGVAAYERWRATRPDGERHPASATIVKRFNGSWKTARREAVERARIAAA